MSDEICDVDITAPDAEWLIAFTRRLVDDGLAASGNIVRDVRTIYRWQGEVRDTFEARVTLHTRRSLVPGIVQRVAAEHPYDVPGVRVTAVEASASYVRWVLDSTRPTPSSR
jgi:periplasmic divalent cation tolerance protein